MDAGALAAHGQSRGAEFYLTALRYAHYLWLRGFAARVILKLDRALLADVPEGDAALREWPLPYAAMAWVLRHAPDFGGNPRVHFQHLAGRIRPPRLEQRRWRMWACWMLCRAARPDLPGDPGHEVEEPQPEQIIENLSRHGHAGEADLWKAALGLASARS